MRPPHGREVAHVQERTSRGHKKTQIRPRALNPWPPHDVPGGACDLLPRRRVPITRGWFRGSCSLCCSLSRRSVSTRRPRKSAQRARRHARVCAAAWRAHVSRPRSCSSSRARRHRGAPRSTPAVPSSSRGCLQPVRSRRGWPGATSTRPSSTRTSIVRSVTGIRSRRSSPSLAASCARCTGMYRRRRACTGERCSCRSARPSWASSSSGAKTATCPPGKRSSSALRACERVFQDGVPVARSVRTRVVEVQRGAVARLDLAVAPIVPEERER